MAIDAQRLRQWIRDNPRHLALGLILLVAIVFAVRSIYNYQLELASEAEKAEKEKKELEKKKKAPKPDFDAFQLVVLPGETKQPLHPVKPGHWFNASFDTRANNFDFVGQLNSSPADNQGQLLDLFKTPYRIVSSRPAVLPKTQKKSLELTFFVPEGQRTRTWLAHRLVDRFGRDVKTDNDLLEHMPAYQYYFFVLAKDSTRYGYIKVLDSVIPPSGESVISRESQDRYYQCVAPVIKDRVNLPSQPLTWSAVAYMLWDDIDPSLLSPDQQLALLDWLHWGGQLIISGPQTLDLLKASFLEPYLPVSAGGSVALDAAALRELSSTWTLTEKGAPGRPIVLAQTWAGVKLIKQADAAFVPGTGELIAERRIGRGRIVVSGFRLSQRELVNWRSFDSFFNACLLRRPPRSYSLDQLGEPRLNWLSEPTRRFDPRLVTGVRYFSRDAGDAGYKQMDADSIRELNASFMAGNFNLDPMMQAGEGGDPMMETSFERAVALTQPGVAAWNDFAPAAKVVRDSLKEAAGISVPRPSFVIAVLCAYLVVLVPLNWAFFRAIGRVELAWAAAPIISIACAMLVIKLARLDIGFAQSRTEIAVVEMHAGHPRAHLTRYTALYTSLSGGYELAFTDSSALVEPFASDARIVANQDRRTVTFERDEQVRLKNFDISSNSTGMLRSEQMLDVGGPITWQDIEGHMPHVINGTRHTFRGAGVLRCVKDADNGRKLEAAWIGEFKPGGDVPLEFAALEQSDFARQREQFPLFAENRPDDTLSLRPLVDLASNVKELLPGDARLIAYFEEDLPGLEITPTPSQRRQATLAVVNLAQGTLAAPRPDANSRADIMALRNEDPAAPERPEPANDDPAPPVSETPTTPATNP